MASAEQKSNSDVLRWDPPGAGAPARTGASYQGDLHMSPLFQVTSSESVLDGRIELVQKREKKENGFQRQFNCSPKEPAPSTVQRNFWSVPFSGRLHGLIFSLRGIYFHFFFNTTEPPACSVASHYVQPVECRVSHPHKLTGPPVGNAPRHKTMTIVVMEKLGTQGLRIIGLIPGKTPLLPDPLLWAFRGLRTHCSPSLTEGSTASSHQAPLRIFRNLLASHSLKSQPLEHESGVPRWVTAGPWG